ncbi:hypothetical protein DMA12_01120 [Amycolatopsis balhimycina DSM 5908]|uniref:DUF1648 domain-containing protein n=1 Tax=Amycolatopsis balhimycina DSM 5908 TaxID=1081091 RepID=A0A428X623_AMYBA|nr:hypothetical protein [Amycolatopsis balhimycina]RSM50782.1 hypothetical protein DMA12_01120 [Amycolatopsis balhimycina DSM 5908]
MVDVRDGSGSGRLRRLVLTVAPMACAAAVPWLLVAAYGDRLPDRAYVDGWSRVGPEYAHLAPTWSSWSAGWLYGLLWAALFGAVFWRVRQWPHLQRVLAAGGGAAGTTAAVDAVCSVLSVLDVHSYPHQPMSWWYDALPPVVGLLGGAVGWFLAGPAPALPEAAEVPAPNLPARRLGRAERAMFSEVVWSVKARVAGLVLLVCAPVELLTRYDAGTAVMLPALGLFMVLQAKARIRIDGDGVLVTLPLLGRARRRVPYEHVRQAEIAERAPAAGWGLTENKRCRGYVTGRGPAMILRLTGDRPFVVSLRDPVAAVALINGRLARERSTGTATGA